MEAPIRDARSKEEAGLVMSPQIGPPTYRPRLAYRRLDELIGAFSAIQ